MGFLKKKYGNYFVPYKFLAIVSYILPVVVAIIIYSHPLPGFEGLGALFLLFSVIGLGVLFHVLAFIIIYLNRNNIPIDQRETVSRMSGGFFLGLILLMPPFLMGPIGFIFLFLMIIFLVIKYWKNIFRKY